MFALIYAVSVPTYLHVCCVNLGESPLSPPPGVTLSSDFMTGFCGESESAHCDTLSLMETVRYDIAYLFAYSMRQVCSLLFVVYLFVFPPICYENTYICNLQIYVVCNVYLVFITLYEEYIKQ